MCRRYGIPRTDRLASLQHTAEGPVGQQIRETSNESHLESDVSSCLVASVIPVNLQCTFR